MKQFMHSFHGLTAPQAILDGVAQGEIRSFCLFAGQNVESPAQLRALTDGLRLTAEDNQHPTPLIGIDQEGGQLVPIRGGATELPGNMALGATRSVELARQAGMVMGRELLAMGINFNFAPSMDVNNNPKNPVIGIRSFGDDPEWVGKLGSAIIQGLQDEGVIATAKHFPGHGDTVMDTHHDSPVVPHNRDRVDDIELKPFRHAIEAGVLAVMTAHITYTTFDEDNPATLSYKILNDLLREAMGFNQLIITDAMDMHAVSQFGNEESVRSALEAGSDIILLGHIKNQLDLAQKFVGKENVASVARIVEAQHKIPRDLPSLDVVGCKEHQAIAQEIADKSITLVRDESGQLPLQLDASQKIAVITPRPSNLTPADTSALVNIKLAECVQSRHQNTLSLETLLVPDESEIKALMAQLEDIDTIIIGTISAEEFNKQAQLITALQAQGKSPIVVALRTPYDILAFPTIETYLCAYGIRDVTSEATAKVLFGEIPATGVLPCVIPGITPQYPDGVTV